MAGCARDARKCTDLVQMCLYTGSARRGHDRRHDDAPGSALSRLATRVGVPGGLAHDSDGRRPAGAEGYTARAV